LHEELIIYPQHHELNEFSARSSAKGSATLYQAETAPAGRRQSTGRREMKAMPKWT
jgi:hypothetical protein